MLWYFKFPGKKIQNTLPPQKKPKKQTKNPNQQKKEPNPGITWISNYLIFMMSTFVL